MRSYLLIILFSACSSSLFAQSHEKTVYTYVAHMPEFPGDYNKYISDNLRYPIDAKKAKKEGKVLLRFLILETGELDSVSIIHGIYPSIDSEAIQVIKNMPRWKPARNDDNIPVRVWYTLPIIFKLD